MWEKLPSGEEGNVTILKVNNSIAQSKLASCLRWFDVLAIIKYFRAYICNVTMLVAFYECGFSIQNNMKDK